MPSNCSAAWYRRSTLISNALSNRAKQLGLDSERKILQAALWDAVPTGAWLSSPEAIRCAGKKLSQLAVAHEVGFTIPQTVVSNSWETIMGNLPLDIVFKTSYPLILFCDNTDLQTLYTTPLTNRPDHLPIAGTPFPGIWQQRIEKAREWRITVVGDQTFDAAIYTDDSAKDDWRKHIDEPGKVAFRPEQFPDEMKKKCIQYLGRFGLRFGAFDFVEDPDAQFTFLECNPNGQYGWLEDTLGFPISNAIADELALIARDH